MRLTTVRRWRATALLGLLAILTLGACNAAAVATEPDLRAGVTGAAQPAGPGDLPADRPNDPGDPAGGSGSGTGGGKDTEPAACESCDPDDPVTSGPADPAPPPGDGATHVTPTRGIGDARAHAIDRISVAADGVTVTVYWYGGVEDCYGLDGVRVDRDADGQVVLTVLEGTRGDAGDMACIDIAVLKATTVTLDAPLFQDGAAG